MYIYIYILYMHISIYIIYISIYLYILYIYIYIYIWAWQGWIKIRLKARTDNWEGFFSYNRTDQARSMKTYIVQTPPPFFKGGGGVSFSYLPQRGRICKLKKGECKYGAGACLLKKRGWHLSYSLFSRFIIFPFRNSFTLCKIVLCI